MARIYRKWPKIDDAELLTLIAGADDRAFKELVRRYAMHVAVLASRVLGTAPPTDLSVAVFSEVRARADDGPRDPASVRDWVLGLALATSLDYQRGTHHGSTRINEDDRRRLAKQIEENSDLFQQIEAYIAHHTMIVHPASQGRVGVARGRYIVTPAFDVPIPEFEEYE